MTDETPELGDCILPGDVMVEILVRVQFVKSLLRFRAVSKSWYVFLRSRDFIKMHLNHQQENEKLLRISDRGPRDTPTISFFTLDDVINFNDNADEDIEVYEDNVDDLISYVIDLPFPCTPEDEVRVVGSCNGLLCVHFNRSSAIILWNPGTRKYRFLDLPSCVSFYYDPFFPYLMLGYVPETDDYKVVKVPSNGEGKRSDVGAWVYTLSSDSWQEIKWPGLLPPKGGSYVAVNGCLYWMSFNGNNGLDVVTSFDLCKHVFGEIKLPESDITDFSIKKLVVLKGCLSMIIYSGRGVNVDCHEVWVMTEPDSWTKQFDFSSFSKLARPVGSWRDNELLFGYPNGWSRELLSYNPFTKVARSFQRRSSLGGFKVINYVESLESVEGS